MFGKMLGDSTTQDPAGMRPASKVLVVTCRMLQFKIWSLHVC